MSADVKGELLALAEDVRALVEIEKNRGLRRVPPGRSGDLPVAEGARPSAPESRNPLVYGVGPEDAYLVVVGEMANLPEGDEGHPLEGPAFDMLERMLANVLDLGRDEVFLLNLVKSRRPGPRGPTPEDEAASALQLQRRLEALQPKVVLVLGSAAFKALFGSSEGIARARGTWRDWNGVAVMPTFHPAYLLRKPGDKRLTFEDLKKVRGRYDSLTGRS